MGRNVNHVHLTGLSADETRSLAATLAAAAIEVEANPGRGTLRVPRSRNRMFHLTQIETVIREWLDAGNHGASLAVNRPKAERPTPPATDDLPLVNVSWPLRMSR